MPQITERSTKEPLIPLTMISHGTLNSVDIGASRRFYEEVLGFSTIQISPLAMIVRLGSDHTYVVVETGELGHMQLLDHNGLDVGSQEAVVEAHAKMKEVKDEYGIRKIMKVQDQHGAYSFYFQDLDANWWEIMYSEERGYAWMFDDPTRDLTGRTDIDLDEMGHILDEEYYAKMTNKT